jgi:hypothetical protein
MAAPGNAHEDGDRLWVRREYLVAGVVGFLGLMLLITGLLAAAWSAQSRLEQGLSGSSGIAAYGFLGLMAAWAVARLRGWGQWCAVAWAVTLALAFPGCLQVIPEVAARLIQPWQRGGPDWGRIAQDARFLGVHVGYWVLFFMLWHLLEASFVRCGMPRLRLSAGALLGIPAHRRH